VKIPRGDTVGSYESSGEPDIGKQQRESPVPPEEKSLYGFFLEGQADDQ